MYSKIILTIIFFSVRQITFCQIEEFTKYYQVDTIILKAKVKKSTDFPTAIPEQIYVTEYDKLGRQISWYYKNDSVRTHFKYSTSKDTLFKYHYCTTNGVKDNYYKLEKFVYSDRKQILYQLSQNINYGKDSNTSEIILDKFYYENNILTDSKHWYKKNYPAKFSINLFLNDTLISLLYEYSYITNSKGQLISRMEKSTKQQIGSIDSFFYDNKNRIIKSVNFRESGYVGEFKANNIRNTTEIIYNINSVIEVNSMKSDLGRNYENKIEKIINSTKLEMKLYGYYDKKKELISRTTYEYY